MNRQGMELSELINKVKKELENARYSDLCIRRFVTVWNRLTNHMVRNSETIFTAKIGMNFLESEYGITVYRGLALKNKRRARAINLLTDYLLHGIIFPKTKQGTRTFHPQFQVLFQGYIDKKSAEGLSKDTLQSYGIKCRSGKAIQD